MRSKSQSQGNKQKVAVEKCCSQPSSSSASSAKKKVTKPTAAVTENKPDDPRPPKKKTRTDYSSSPDEVQILFKETMLNDLPQNVLHRILGLLPTPILLAARLANRKFNEISCKILCSRPKAKFEFFASSNEFFYYAKTGTRNLKDFIACFKKSKIVPFSHFSFCFEDNPIQPKSFDRREWLDFLSLFGDPNFKMTIKCLRLFIRHVGDRSNLVIFLGYLRDLLLNKIKALEEFGLDISPQDGVEMDASKINLFPSSSSSSSAQKTSPIELPHLKFLHLGNSLSEEYPGIVSDLLKAAVNLKKIQVLPEYDDFEMYNLTASTYQLLQSTGKIHCLEETEIHLSDEFLNVIKNQMQNGDGATPTEVPISPPEFVQKFKLKRMQLNLHLDVATRKSENGVITNFISNVLSSSKNSLETLTLEPLGFLENLQLSTFKNLKELGFICRCGPLSGDSFQFLPRGVRSRNTFPAVQLLDLTNLGSGDWCDYFSPQDSIPRLPNVKTLSLGDWKLTANSIVTINLICGNLKELKITRGYCGPKINFLQVARAIWTDMKQLESLEIDVDVDSVGNSTSNLDSCFTGFSLENCQRLHEVMSATKTFKKWGVEIPKSDPNIGLEREFASILEMKDLRRLIINPYSGVKLLEQKYFFKDKLTWISEEYAFKLMPQLQIEEQKKN